MKFPYAFPARYVLVFWTFIGVHICYILKANLGVAIVAMVKLSGDTNNSTRYTSCNNELNNYTVANTTKEGEFDWSKSTQGIILSSFFYGYIITQIPGGVLSEKYSGKWVFAFGMFIASFSSLLTPFVAQFHVIAVIGIRLVEGMGAGLVFPAFYSLYSNWIPFQERSRVIAITNCGAHIGTIIAMPTTAWLCVYGFLGGWPSVFYVFGGIGLIWFICWTMFTYNKPENHPVISLKEMDYILVNRKSKKSTFELNSVPWKKIMTSPPVWALAITKFSGCWTYYTMLTELPTYVQAILNFPIKENGNLNSIIYIAIAVTSLISGALSDYIRSKEWITISAVRKTFQAFATFGPALMFGLIPFMGCNVQGVICLLIGAMALCGASSGGESPTAIDMAADYTGIVFGFSNCVGNLAGVLTPVATGFITEGNDPMRSWHYVFYLTSLVNVIGGLSFLIWGSAHPQSWSKPLVDEKNLITN